MDRLSSDPTPSGAVCIPNISTSERRKRLYFGVGELVITLAILAGMLAFGLGRWWRLLLLPLLVGAAEGYFQWRDHT